MTTTINPYLNFRDTTKDAMSFYHSVFGGELATSTFADFHASEDPSEQDKITHSMLTSDNGLVLMAADTPNSMEYRPGTNHAISLSGDSSDDAELRCYWDKLSAGGTVQAPLAQAPWGDTFGMCVDKFGVRWLVNIAAQQ